MFNLIPTLLMSTFYYFKKIYFYSVDNMSESVSMYTRGQVPAEAVSVGSLGTGVSGGC